MIIFGNGTKIFACAAALLLTGGCVDIPVQEDAGRDRGQSVRLPGMRLDPGAKEARTLHFTVQAYGQDKVDAYGRTVEDLYSQIMRDTGLYSFVPRDPYEILVFADRNEYLSKTGMPQWSGGATFGNAIAVYDYSGAQAVLAHEMLHLIFNEYIGRSDSALVWINEGLAVRTQLRAMTSGDQQAYRRKQAEAIAARSIPFSRMVSFIPLSEQDSLVGDWYMQVESVTSYLLDQEGAISFSKFITELRSSADVNVALARAYPSSFPSLAKLESKWRASLNLP